MNELATGGVAESEQDTPCATPQPLPITQRLVAVVEHLLHHKLDKWDHSSVCKKVCWGLLLAQYNRRICEMRSGESTPASHEGC
jgi:hypothetical protein